MFYVYTYFIDGVPRYVGKGAGGRWSAHRAPTKRTKLANTLRSRFQKTGEWIRPFIEHCESEESAFQEEVRLIAHYGREDLGKGPLWNLTDGGERNSGFKHTEQWKEKKRQASIGEANPFYGKQHSEETLTKMRKAQRAYADRSGTPELHAQVAKLRTAGKTHQQISDEVGISRRGVTAILTGLNMTKRKKGAA